MAKKKAWVLRDAPRHPAEGLGNEVTTHKNPQKIWPSVA